jgi:hypothetical protein
MARTITPRGKGRPPLPDGPQPTVTVSIRLSLETYADLRMLARRDRRTATGLATLMVEDAVAARVPAPQAAE